MGPTIGLIGAEAGALEALQGWYATLLLAENGRLDSRHDKLLGMGFQLRRIEEHGGQSLTEPVLLVIDRQGWQRQRQPIMDFIAGSHYSPPVIQLGDSEEEPPNLQVLLPEDFTDRQLFVALREAARSAGLARQVDRLGGMLQSGHSELQKLIEIGISLSSERSIDRLLDKILLEACNVTSADAGSIYIIDQDEQGNPVLRFSNTRSDSLNVDFKEFTMPIDPSSIAGYVALTGESLIIDDCYHIPDQYAFSINRSFDLSNNYRTKSMLAVAMRDQKDQITGVIQLINRKPRQELRLTDPQQIEGVVEPFGERSRDLISALASQAAVALENYRLYRDIEHLFEGFVQAAVTAIESRDPTTCGHSERVTTLTVGLAEAVGRTLTGPLRGVHFSENQLKEIRYACLLHDFGKVGVRENVLLKAKKLYPWHLEVVKKRFELARQIMRAESERAMRHHLLDHCCRQFEAGFEEIEREFKARLERLDEYLELVVRANEPAMLETESCQRLTEISETSIPDGEGGAFPLLDPEEHRVLSIPKGSLTPEERREVESHVSHTYNFLTKIPWTRELQNIPEIAYGHHETMDGRGYPRGIPAGEIQLQCRMMAIADIFDALTATDRPYKPAMSVERALEIIHSEVKRGKLDADLVQVFIESRVYELTAAARAAASPGATAAS